MAGEEAVTVGPGTSLVKPREDWAADQGVFGALFYPERACEPVTAQPSESLDTDH